MINIERVTLPLKLKIKLAEPYCAFNRQTDKAKLNDKINDDVPFPKTFPNLCRKILTRLFRVFVHVYIHHFDRIVSIGALGLVVDYHKT
ncbi:hypothetical protein FF38_07471 [Lucilia cuprina]|uniref:Uncharacterized protein n=1 Tax=Lucilia cuprina TaxID=7375 RepID=A0A0L0CBJ3_LUCCU|nr:hypothetical protein FF38_07471 [Lucilia cuprina]